MAVRNHIDSAAQFETIGELFRRVQNGRVGIVSTAYLADATPAAMTAYVRSVAAAANHVADDTHSHNRLRGQYGAVVDSFFNGANKSYPWYGFVSRFNN